LKLTEKCKELKSLNISNVPRITDRTLRALSEKIKNLESLDISNCTLITGMDCFYLKKLKNLKLLLIKNIKFCDIEVQFLDDLRNLETLSISSNLIKLGNFIFSFRFIFIDFYLYYL
jgi:hypothetical protein